MSSGNGRDKKWRTEVKKVKHHFYSYSWLGLFWKEREHLSSFFILTPSYNISTLNRGENKLAEEFERKSFQRWKERGSRGRGRQSDLYCLLAFRLLVLNQPLWDPGGESKKESEMGEHTLSIWPSEDVNISSLAAQMCLVPSLAFVFIS